MKVVILVDSSNREQVENVFQKAVSAIEEVCGPIQSFEYLSNNTQYDCMVFDFPIPASALALTENPLQIVGKAFNLGTDQLGYTSHVPSGYTLQFAS